jgi:hypothetical protein
VLKLVETTSITITQNNDWFPLGTTLLLDVDSYVPFEPSAYVWEPGWNCSVKRFGDLNWFFIAESGSVWYHGTELYDVKAIEIGICPEQEKYYDAQVQLLKNIYSEEENDNVE